jgi:hypothetical protein
MVLVESICMTRLGLHASSAWVPWGFVSTLVHGQSEAGSVAALSVCRAIDNPECWNHSHEPTCRDDSATTNVCSLLSPAAPRAVAVRGALEWVCTQGAGEPRHVAGGSKGCCPSSLLLISANMSRVRRLSKYPTIRFHSSNCPLSTSNQLCIKS